MTATMTTPLSWEDGVRFVQPRIDIYDCADDPWQIADLRITIDALISASNGAVDADEIDQDQWDSFWGVFGATGKQLWLAKQPAFRGDFHEYALTTLVAKQRAYGHTNISRFGRTGLVVRAHDKVARVENLTRRGGNGPAEEPLADAYLDIYGYSCIALMWDRGLFALELAEDLAAT